MEKNNEIRLRQLLSKRKENINVIQQFRDLFFNFARVNLKNTVKNISTELETYTYDYLKIFYDDPYENTRNPYFALVQLFIGNNQNEIYLESTKNNPAIKFEGLQFNAKIKVTIKLQNQLAFVEFAEEQIQNLDNNRIEELLITFIEKVYNS